MKSKIATWVLAASFAAPAAGLRAEDKVIQVAESYNQMKAESNRKDISKDHRKIASARERQEYWKEWTEIAQKQYNKALNAYGPNSDLTEDAKSRYEKAVNEQEAAMKDVGGAQRSLDKNRQELQDAQQGMNKEKQDR